MPLSFSPQQSQKLKQDLNQWLESFWSTATPGLCLEVYQGGKKIWDYQGGEVYPYYDLASLTKVLFTVPAYMSAMQAKLWTPETKVSEYLSWWPHPQTKIIDLLTHTSGLVWWKAFYEDLEKDPTRELLLSSSPLQTSTSSSSSSSSSSSLHPEISSNLSSQQNLSTSNVSASLSLSQRWEHLKKDIQTSTLVDGGAAAPAVYSDVGFLSLAFLLEEMRQQSLSAIWEKTAEEFLSSSKHPSSSTLKGSSHTLHWNPTLSNQITSTHDGSLVSSKVLHQVSSSNPGSISAPHSTSSGSSSSLIESSSLRFPASLYAPTEFCPWRKRRLQGEVHDENAWSLGGLSTHAGLFGSPSDVAAVFLFLRAAYLDKTHPYHSVVRFFLKRQIPKERGDWALGLMMPTLGSSSSGQYFTPEQSFGHTGFTGTSVWWDAKEDLLIVLLSNRVYYGRDKREFAKLRPLLHDKIISCWRSEKRSS